MVTNKNIPGSTTVPGATAETKWWTKPWFHALFVAFFTFLCFTPVLNNGFINWDDNGYVFENEQMGKPLSESVPYFFGAHYFIGNYIPLTMLVYALQYKVAGLNPQFFHFISLFIHALNVILMFWFIYRLSNKRTFVATLVALLFGVHPMHVESVAWVAELKDVLYCFFFLAGLITYINYNEGSNKRIWLVFTFLLFLVSVLCKPAAIVFPLVILLIDYYRERKTDKRLWLEKLPFMALSLVFGFVALNAQYADELLRTQYAWWQKICFASYSSLNYIVKSILPIHQAIFHPYPVLGNQPLPIYFYLAPLALVLLFYIVIRTQRKTRLYVFGLLFFIVNVLLVLQFVSVGDAIMAERYTYVSYTGVFFIVATKAYDFRKRWRAAGKVIIPLFLVAVLLLGYITYQRCKVWRNSDTIANDLLEKYPQDWLAMNNKGYILFEQGKIEEAIELFENALKIKPEYTRASINLSNAYLRLNKPELSLKVNDQALERKPDDYNLIFNKGYFLYVIGQYAESLKWFDKSIELDKTSQGAYLYKSECYYYLKDYPNALKAADEGLKLQPGNYLLLNNKGYFLMQQKRYKEAIPFFELALRIKPEYNTTTANLNNCLQLMNSAPKPTEPENN